MSKQYPYEVHKIAEGIHLIDEKLSTMFVVEGTEKALVIDCGTGAGDFKSVVESITKLPYTLVATHAHVDHIGGRGQFPDMYISAVDAPKIKSVTLAYRRFYSLSNSMAGSKANMKKMTFEKTKTEPKVHIVKEGDRFDLGGRVLTVIENPGHTCGSISLLSESDGILFAGDVANPFLFMWLSNCTTIAQVVPTLEKLYNLPGYDKVWASHALKPMTRTDVGNCLNAARGLAQKKNTLLPLIKLYKQDGVVIVYRSTHIK